MISVPWSNQHAHKVISEKLLSNEFHYMTIFEHVNIQVFISINFLYCELYRKLCSLKIKIVLPINDEISVQLMAALGFKWDRLWQ